MVRVCITTSASSNNIKSYRVMVEHVYPEDDVYASISYTSLFIHTCIYMGNKQTYISFNIHHASYNSED